VIEQRHAVQVRHPDDVDVQVKKVDVQGLDALRFAQRKYDVQTANVMNADQRA
jgi:hypothetical protein